MMLRYAVNVGRKRVHDDATAAALLDAAEVILEAEGLEALTVRRVAEATGTTTRAVYASLGSKEALLSGLCVRAFDLLGARVAAQPRSGDPATDLVAAGTMGFRAWALEHPVLFRVGFLHQVSIPKAVWSRSEASAERALATLHERIQHVENAGGLGGRTLQAATWQFHSLCEGLAIMDLRNGSPGPSSDSLPIWTDALNSLVTGWRATSAPKAGDLARAAKRARLG
jgi:AcrR family transcriptional regulator